MAKAKILVKIKKLVPQAIIPKYAKEGDAGMDLTAVSKKHDSEACLSSFGTGIAMEIPKGHVGLIFPRSSVYKVGSVLSNSVGVIDSGYRGEITAKFYEGVEDPGYNIGDRIAQIVIIPFPEVEFIEVDELGGSERGKGGYGSTGK